MFNPLRLWRTSRPLVSTEKPLFSGSAYFSNHVSRTFTEKWVSHGGEISSGTTFDPRARYFFATDPSEPWAARLFSKSVTVIHVGWIAHCIDEAFQVPISEYILDDRFVPEPPYKLVNSALPICVSFSEPGKSTDTEFSESTHAQSSETPSTPTSALQKRKREQAFFDSPSGSLVFSGFGKDGMPRRPRKQRKLRFDPSFSPDCESSGRVVIPGKGLGLLQDDCYSFINDDGVSRENNQDRRANALRTSAVIRSPDTPDRPVTYAHPHQCLPAISIDVQNKAPPIRTIDFTNLPPRTRRFQPTKATDSKDMISLSAVKSTGRKIKRPKKISFADHAQVCVYMVSPQRVDAKDSVGAQAVPSQGPNEEFGSGPEASEKDRASPEVVECSDDLAAKTIKELGQVTKIKDAFVPLSGGEQVEMGSLQLTVGQVRAIRRRLQSAARNGDNNGRLATLFQLGKNFRGMAFRHIW